MSAELTPQAALRIISVLRDGTAPDDGLELLTVGREKWVASLKEDLQLIGTGDRRVRLFNGRYGDGKTHLMKLLRVLAFLRGFVVSYVVIKREVPLNRWDLLYTDIVRGFHTASRPNARGLTAILDPRNPDPAIVATFAEKSERVRTLQLHPDFATAIYKYTNQLGTLDQQQDQLTLRSWIEGQPVAKQVLRGFGISAPVDKHSGLTMLQSIATCLTFYGYAGIVILLDEVESTLAQGKVARGQAYENLRLLIDRDQSPAFSLVIASITPEMFVDAEKAFQSYPALWRRIADFGDRSRIGYRNNVVDLTRTPLTSCNYLDIGKHIRTIHAMAHEWPATKRVTDEYLHSAADLAASGKLTLAFSPTGVFVKLITEELDAAEQDRSYSPSVDQLRQRFSSIGNTLHTSHSAEPW